jgi:hypothetical protein
MPRSDRSRPALGFWRIVLLLAAGALGVAALCLVVFGNSQRQLQFGVLLGLWAFLIGAFLGFGSLRSQSEQAAAVAEAERRSAQLHEAQLQVSQLQYAQLEAAQEVRSRQEVELRKFGEMQLSREAAARREADFNLEISLRREIERMMTEQLGALRDEVAALRAEVVDKLGGQLRLERIETTRVIGSDLEALQHEIRRLAGSQESIAHAPAAVSAPLAQLPRQAAEPVGASRPDRHDIVDAEVIEPESSRAEPTPEPAGEAEPQPVRAGSQPVPVASEPPAAGRPTAKPGWSAPTVVGANPPAADKPDLPGEQSEPSDTGSVPPLYRKSERVAAFTDSFDPFAGLPRLSPLPDDIELIQDPEPVQDEPVDEEPAGRRRAPDAGEQRYHGRRRADGEPEEAPVQPETSGGRRRADGEAAGRRRAPDDAPDDLLTRITER